MANANSPARARQPETTAYASPVSTTSLQRTTAGPRSHPGPDELLRFLRGEVSQDEAQAIVRHLLAGCPECSAVTRPVWRLAERKLKLRPLDRKKLSARKIRLEAIR